MSPPLPQPTGLSSFFLRENHWVRLGTDDCVAFQGGVECERAIRRTKGERNDRGSQLGLAGEAGRGGLPAGGEQLEGDGDVDVEVEELELDRSAEAYGGLELQQPAEDGAAVVRRRVADLDVDEPTEEIDASADLQGVDGAGEWRCRRWRAGGGGRCHHRRGEDRGDDHRRQHRGDDDWRRQDGGNNDRRQDRWGLDRRADDGGPGGFGGFGGPRLGWLHLPWGAAAAGDDREEGGHEHHEQERQSRELLAGIHGFQRGSSLSCDDYSQR